MAGTPELANMKSQNFEFLRPKREVLADLAGFAESYAHDDPASSLIKQRSFVEHAVIAIYQRYRLRPPLSDNLNDLMNAEPFRQSVPEVVQNKLHTVRKAGNHAAHPRQPITSLRALDCLTHLFDIARWFHVQVEGGDRGAAPAYVSPPPEPAGGAKTKDALEKLRLAEAKYESVLAALDAETKKRLEAERVATEHATELGKLKEEGQKVASVLQFNEAATRQRLIDESLIDAGWKVGANGADTEQVKQEVALSGLKSPPGKGSADYVLYGDDGKPLAVVEATDELLRSAFLEMFGDPVINPKGWPVRPLGDVLDHLDAGWSANGDARPRNNDEYGVLKVSAVTSGIFRPEEHKAVSASAIDRELVTPRRGDLLFSRANTRDLVAATCLVERDEPRLFLPDKLWRVGPRADATTAPYLRFLLAHDRFRSELTKTATGTSGSMLNVSMEKLRSLRGPFPPIDQQRMFAALTWKSLDAKARCEAAHEWSETLFNSLVARAFSGSLETSR